MKLYIGLILLTAALPTLAQKSPSAPPAGQTHQPTAAAPPTGQTQPITVPTTIVGLKTALEQSPNPVLYTKQILKRRFKIDTIVVTRTRVFNSIADSLAYHGKEKKVYGPYGPKGGQFLVQLLTKAPNQFFHVGQIFIDTSVFSRRVADSLGNMIIAKIKSGSATFEQMAITYRAIGICCFAWVYSEALLQPVIA